MSNKSIFSIEKIPAIVAAISATAFAASTIHEFGFFLIIGLEWQSILTTKDYIIQTLQWLPRIIFFQIIFQFLLEPLFKKAVTPKEKNSNELGKKSNIEDRIIKIFSFLAVIIFLITIISLLFLPIQYVYVFFNNGLGILICILFFRKISTIDNIKDLSISMAYLCVILVSLLAFTLGIVEGNKILSEPDNVYNISLKDKSHYTAYIARRTQDGLLFLNSKTNHFTFLDKNEIYSITNYDIKKLSQPLICEYKNNSYCLNSEWSFFNKDLF